MTAQNIKPRWKHAPPGSHWGEFGPDDRLGRMNLVTPVKVRQGMAEGELLKTFNCGIGMMLVVAPDRVDATRALLEAAGETVCTLGRVVEGQGVIYKGRLL